MAPRSMSSADVLRVLDHLEQRGCRVWIGGGWGVDALMGRPTRNHRDLDLAIDSSQESLVIEALTALGFAIETDWRPVRVELAAPGSKWVDLHPVRFDADGNGVQDDLDGGSFEYPAACFVTGLIDGRVVPCLSIEQQLAFHSGYEPRDIDLADLQVLHALLQAQTGTASRTDKAPGGRMPGG